MSTTRQLNIAQAFDFEAALRICAEVHRQRGEVETAGVFEAGAIREARKKWKAIRNDQQSFEDWLKSRADVILA